MPGFENKSHTKTKRDIDKTDIGVDVKSVVELVKENKYYDQLASLLDMDGIIDDFIEIPGARTLTELLKVENKKYRKFDLPASYNDLQFIKGDDDTFHIKFINIREEKFTSIIGADNFTCEMAYSAKSDFFGGLFSMQPFASSLTKKGYSFLVYENLESIRKIHNKPDSYGKVYRILKDQSGSFFLRAIVSDQYNDYDDNITAFLGLIGMHYEMKKSKSKFYIDRFDYNESFVRILFAKEATRTVEKIGEIKYVIEVSNDEIKRETLKFTSAVSIIFDNKRNVDDELYLKPTNVKSQILSIKHNATPKTAISILGSLSNYVDKEEIIYNDILRISNIKSPDQIRYAIFAKLSSTRQPELSNKVKIILAQLSSTVNTLYDLFKALHKVELLIQDIEAKEYLRYLLYDALVTGKIRPDEKSDDE